MMELWLTICVVASVTRIKTGIQLNITKVLQNVCAWTWFSRFLFYISESVRADLSLTMFFLSARFPTFPKHRSRLDKPLEQWAFGCFANFLSKLCNLFILQGACKKGGNQEGISVFLGSTHVLCIIRMFNIVGLLDGGNVSLLLLEIEWKIEN